MPYSFAFPILDVELVVGLAAKIAADLVIGFGVLPPPFRERGWG